ncbi:hypothetical protein OH77DRAFT_1508356 [Trametes cingulata]|nr:hypothetical protein OH77DRAFT_1508356 [Trametes cingulata]
MPTTLTCTVCSRPSVLRCAFCTNGPVYCSNKHFNEHWQIHGRACQGHNDAGTRSSPSVVLHDSSASTNEPHYARTVRKAVQALFLEASADCGIFTSVECHRIELPDGQRITVPNLRTFLPNGQASVVLHFNRDRQNLDKPLHVIYCTHSFVVHTNWNIAVQSLMADSPDGLPARYLAWPGNIVVMKYADNLCTDYEDLVDGDLDTVRAYFEKVGMWR